ncbi:EAL domain-containing protein [Sulfurimonas sp.]|uniref:sensor domain-containing protein n=1 Tax=Sulfurimonas sp. TaxID=2022749 RepID=UPI00286D9A22|nr:EAL domain-containing protein [Sulfurimonas sp.]
MQENRPKCRKNAFYISLIYFIFGLSWILFSDATVAFVVDNANEITSLQIYKGAFFILVTTLILYFLTYRFFHIIQSQCDANIKQIKKNSEIKESLKISQGKLSRYDMLLSTIVNSSPDAIFAKDLEGKYILFNNGAANITNADAKEMIGKNDYDVFESEVAKKHREIDKKIIDSREVVTFEERNITKDGRANILLVTKGPILDEFGEPFGLFGIARNITEQKEHESFLEESREKFYNLSHIDKVTKLPNRLYISEVLVEKCSQEVPFCLIFLDLDEFKIVNDSYGHRFGDKLLYEVSKLLLEVFDSSAFIARMGGDEFAIAINSSDKKEIERLMQKLHHKFNNPFKIDMVDVYITASSGICIYPDDAQNMEGMYQASDTAMYKAKGFGKNNFSFYSAEFKKEAVEYTQMVTSLKQAIEKSELELYFQPQNDVQTGKIVGAEALLRWKSEGKMIPPDVFIPLAEKSSLIVEIGDFVLKSGFETAKRWYEMGILKGRIAINVSARQLIHLDFIKTLEAMLKESGCEASWIELEITESSVLENPQLVINLLEQLRALGFYISMDDFGTGYSSLSYLKNLPIDKLKIDRSFIMNIREQPKNQTIVKTIIFLAKELGIHVLAEGVETEDEHSFLLENKIDSIQGYYYSKPLPLSEMQKLLEA